MTMTTLATTPTTTLPAVLAGTHRATTRGLIIDLDGNVLIVRSRIGRKRWYVPGGKIEHGESPRVACRRELAEELGVDIRPGALLVSAWNPDPVVGRPDSMSYLFDCGTVDSATFTPHLVVQASEISDWRWATLGTAITLLEPGLAALLLAAHNGTRYLEAAPPSVSGPRRSPWHDRRSGPDGQDTDQ